MKNKTIDLKRKQEAKEETLFLDWRVSEETARGKKMQIGIIFFLIFCFVFFIWQKNYFGLGLMLVITFFLFLPMIKNRETHFALVGKGALREKEVFPWKNIESFWIFEKPSAIYFKSKKKNSLYHIVFPLPHNYVEKARKIMLNFIPEEEMERTFFDIMSELLGL